MNHTRGQYDALVAAISSNVKISNPVSMLEDKILESPVSSRKSGRSSATDPYRNTVHWNPSHELSSGNGGRSGFGGPAPKIAFIGALARRAGGAIAKRLGRKAAPKVLAEGAKKVAPKVAPKATSAGAKGLTALGVGGTGFELATAADTVHQGGAAAQQNRKAIMGG